MHGPRIAVTCLSMNRVVVCNVKTALHQNAALVQYTDTMREYIANEVYELRIARGVTQEALAEALKVSRQTVIAIEKGKYAPSVMLALTIAKYFKLPVEKIFTIKYEK
jgi:putative transcriptional regulator